MPRAKKLVIIGDSAFAEVACEYFETWSPHQVTAFAVEPAFLKRDSLLGRPVISLDDLTSRFSPEDHMVFVAVVYTQLNRLRARLAETAKAMGYQLASFISPHAFVAPSARLGEHCFVFENNVIQSFVEIGSNVVLWSGNHIGHHSKVADNVFVSSHVVVSGFCGIGANTFLGVNVSIANNVTVANDCWVGPGVVIARDTVAGEVYRSSEAQVAKVSALRFFRVSE
jgi:sugar O-acyltransferase (sialic acid O-acetyltransferase NeuD family)